MKSPIVTLLIPIYNVEGYIEMAARSVLDQSYAECRYIFVDDCSTDNSVAELERVIGDYPHREPQITIIKNASNQGVGAVRNQLLDAAQGDYVLFVDSDDWIDYLAVESLVTRASVTSADITRSWRVVDYEDSSKLDRVGWLDTTPHRTLCAVLEQSHLFPNYIHGLLIRRGLIEDHALRFPKGINMGEDYTFLSKMLYHAKSLAQVSMPLYHYRSNRAGSYMSHITPRGVDSYICANRDVTDFFMQVADRELYHESLIWGKLNIKKWVIRRGCPLSRYDNQIMGGVELHTLSQKIYNKVLIRNNQFAILILFALRTLRVSLAINFSKYRGERSNRQKKMWG